jgi:hypothetical protein
MRNIAAELADELLRKLPETCELLRGSNLTIHPAVARVVLTGSRGLKGGYRPDSDIDLSLLVDSEAISATADQRGLFQEVMEMTLDEWKSDVQLDTAAVFDKSDCGLRCFLRNEFVEGICSRNRPDCVGLYKIQKGFTGLVPDIGLEIRSVFPMIAVWNRS